MFEDLVIHLNEYPCLLGVFEELTPGSILIQEGEWAPITIFVWLIGESEERTLYDGCAPEPFINMTLLYTNENAHKWHDDDPMVSENYWIPARKITVEAGHFRNWRFYLKA